MQRIERYFLELLKYSIGSISSFEELVLSDEDWDELHRMAGMQTVIGVCFHGIQKLPKVKQPYRKLLLMWFAESEMTAVRNQEVDSNAVRLTRKFGRYGFESCILKGQGNALMYPVAGMRTSGDIDIWLVPKVTDGKKMRMDARKVLKYIYGRFGEQDACYNHVQVPEYRGTMIEVHYRPAFVNNPIYNRRIQNFFGQDMAKQFEYRTTLGGLEGCVSIPTDEFNVVYQMVHLMHHFLYEGLGLRQIVDYYYLLKKQERTDNSRKQLFRRLGLYRFATAVMWVLHEALGMPQEWMVVPPDERRGRFLLKEMLLVGNFGKYDERVSDKEREDGLAKNLQRLKRDARLVFQYPSECLWEPVFRVYHWWWRRRHGYRRLMK